VGNFKPLILGPPTEGLKHVGAVLRQHVQRFVWFETPDELLKAAAACDALLLSPGMLKDTAWILPFRLRHPDACLIADYSGYDEATARKECFEAGVDAYWTVPKENILGFAEEVFAQRKNRSNSSAHGNVRHTVIVACAANQFLPTTLGTLAGHGWLIHSPLEAYSALELLRRGRIDAVFCDFVLPGMQGEKFATAICNYDPSVAIFCVKEWSHLLAELGELHCRARDVLLTPIGVKQISSAVREGKKRLAHHGSYGVATRDLRVLAITHKKQGWTKEALGCRITYDFVKDANAALQQLAGDKADVLLIDFEAIKDFKELSRLLAIDIAVVTCISPEQLPSWISNYYLALLGFPLIEPTDGEELVGRLLHAHERQTFLSRLHLFVEDLRVQLSEIFAANTHLKATDAARSTLLSDASHELRNPLAAITAALSLLERGKVGEFLPDQKKLLNSAARNVSRLDNLITDLLDLAKYEAGRVAVDVATFDLASVLQDSKTVMEQAAIAKNMTIAIDVAQEMPKFVGDKIKVERVLVNLLSNAIKYTPVNGQVTIRGFYSEDTDEFLVEISDTGMGIPKTDIENIFSPFYRVARDEQSATPGTGLGLAIVKSLVELHEGKISVTSELNQGTTFSLVFPKLKQDVIAILRLRSAIRFARRSMVDMAVVVVELENFQTHTNADTILNSLATHLSRSQSGGAEAVELMPKAGAVMTMLMRSGGQDVEEFVVRLRTALNQWLGQLAEKLREPTDDLQFKVGTAVYPENGTLAEELIAFASAHKHHLVAQKRITPDIVAIDDEASIRNLLNRTLTSGGFSVRLAEDGAHGLELLHEKNPDLVICDLMMPNMDGYTFVRQLRVNPRTRDVPVLILTADPDADVGYTLDLGATEFIAKPFSPAVLVNIVKRLLHVEQADHP
jgi:signal transduction histidine kinase/CheY-like chemotaxis protein